MKTNLHSFNFWMLRFIQKINLSFAKYDVIVNTVWWQKCRLFNICVWLYQYYRIYTRRFVHGYTQIWCTQWRSWLSHCTTSREAAGWIPDILDEIFIGMVLPAALCPWGLTQPLVEMSTTGNSSTIMCRLFRNPASLNLLDCPGQPSLYKDSFIFTFDTLNVVNSKLYRNKENSFFVYSACLNPLNGITITLVNERKESVPDHVPKSLFRNRKVVVYVI